MTHELVDNTLIREAGGIVAVCTCGWRSREHFTSLSASVAFRTHAEGSDPYPEQDDGNP